MIKRVRYKEGFFVYDLINGKDVYINNTINDAKKLGIDYTSISKLRKGASLHIDAKFILPENKNKIFTLIDVDTKKEYDCIDNKSLFRHLNIPYNNNAAKYIYELKSGRQNVASIHNKIFMLKGSVLVKRFITMKAESLFINSKRYDAANRKNIKDTIHSRVLKALCYHGQKKTDSLPVLIGCTTDNLKKYIESKFTLNMSWDNRCEWNVDHIIPCEKFDLTKKEDQIKCFHYTNLQPIWASTSTAIKYGETKNYVGNKNKNSNTKYSFDYSMVYKLKPILGEENAMIMAKRLFDEGYRKVDNSNDVPMQDGTI